MRDWALHIADEMGIADFQAKAIWILLFKLSHRIGSKYITKLFKKLYRNEATIEQTICNFLEVVETKFADFSKPAVYNANQSSTKGKCVQNALYLSFVGEKHTESAVLSVNASIH
jgi:hypothetical protein